MSNLGDRGNMLPQLSQPKEPPPQPVEPFPSEKKIFSNKKIKKVDEPINDVNDKVEVIEETTIQQHKIEYISTVPLTKKGRPRKKAVISEDAKRRMEEGRKKGLATRRKRQAEKKARQIEQMKAQGLIYEKPPENKVEKTMNIAKEVIDSGVRNASIDKPPVYPKQKQIDPDHAFNSFVNMMDRYEKIRIERARKKRAPANQTASSQIRQAPKVRPPSLASQRWGMTSRGNPRPASNQAYIGQNGFNQPRQRINRLNKETRNPFMQYFS